MSIVDWLVLTSTLLFIVVYGVWKTRRNKDLNAYLKGGNQMNWSTIGLSVMATQASAITFLSTPGQAFESGMGFVQNYFGLPLALIVVSVVFIPIFYKLNVFTAYEYLENRFDVRIRSFAAFLFLIQRGLAAGITIYAPAIILSTVLDWNLQMTILFVGGLVIIYTVSGGTKAVSLTQKWQMTIILAGMIMAFLLIVDKFPTSVSFNDAMHIAGNADKLNAVNFSFDLSERYTVWSGLLGGFFLALSYFGTDQSQVQRYLGGKSIKESRLGLMFNAILKIPMQFFILLTGVLVFVFYQFHSHPVIFNTQAVNALEQSKDADKYEELNEAYQLNWQQKKELQLALIEEEITHSEKEKIGLQIKQLLQESNGIVAKARTLMVENDLSKSKDSDYVFLSFIMNEMPKGIIGLLLAMIISAAMSSTSSELNALGSTTTVDFYKRFFQKEQKNNEVLISKIITTIWGILALTFAFTAHLLENLIEAVNILGSLFYGTILGIFLTGFFIKQVNSRSLLIGASIVQLTIFALFYFYFEKIGYLWFNVIGSLGTIVVSFLIATMLKPKST